MARPRTPTIIKELRGTTQPCRINVNEPKLEVGGSPPPPGSSSEFKTHWNNLTKYLSDMAVLSHVDTRALIQLCDACVIYEQAKAALASKSGLTYESTQRDGSIVHKKHPELEIMNEQDKRIQYWLGRFGLTPADRSRVSATPNSNSTNVALAKFLSNTH